MKVLWITNIPMSKHREMLQLGEQKSGGWLEASYNALKDSDELTIGVVTAFFSDTLKKDFDGKHVFYILPFEKSLEKYNYQDNKNKAAWKRIIDDFKPDIIQLWGTEFAHGLCALTVAGNIPSVVYIQGMVSQISRHYLDGLNCKDIITNITLGDIVTKGGMLNENRRTRQRAFIESKILNISRNIIVESRWCANSCKAIAPESRIFKSLIPINTLFQDYHWDYDEIEPYSIFSVAGGYPIKSHHTLFRALAMVKKSYPNVKLYLPGKDYHNLSTLKQKLFRSGYNRFASRLIKKYELNENVVFTGPLSPGKMAEYMKKCHVFVMPSSCENHSTTLIEAMIVGAPCVSTNVGGIQEYAIDGQNCLLYRFGEVDEVAQDIMNIFRDKKLAMSLSKEASNSARDLRYSIDLRKDFTEIYKAVSGN